MNGVKRNALCVLIISLVLCFMPIDFSHAESTIQISNLSITHTSVSFTLTGQNKAGDATLSVKGSDGSEFSIPFTITNDVQDVDLNTSGSDYFKKGVTYSFQVIDAEKKTSNVVKREKDVDRIVGTFSASANPQQLIIKNYSYGEATNAKVKVGFKEYEGTLSNGQIVVNYPNQKVGTKIVAEISDGYGCSVTETYTISMKSLGTISATAYPSCVEVLSDFDSSDGIRACAQVDGKTYYSDYVTSGWKQYIYYPQQSVGTPVIVWKEDKHGNVSHKTTFKVRSDTINLYGFKFKAYPKQLKLTCGDKVQAIDVIIGGITYPATKENGIWIVSYPRQEDGTTCRIIAYDIHRCSAELTAIISSDDKGGITIDDQTSSLISGLVKFAGDSLKSVTATINGTTYQGTIGSSENADYGASFSIPIHSKVGTKVVVKAEDNLGNVYTKNVTIPNVKPDLDISQVTTSTKVIEGTTLPGAKVKAQVGGKKYTRTADENGDFSIKTGYKRSGTAIRITVTTEDGSYITKNMKVKKNKGSIVLKKTIYRNSTSVKCKISNAWSGDYILMKIGKKTYKKKISKSYGSKHNITFKIPKQVAGTKVKLSYLDRFGDAKGAKKSAMVYYGNKIFVGMSSHNALLTTWGKPDHRNYYGSGTPVQWVWDDDDGLPMLLVYIRGGKVIDFQSLD